MQMKIFSEQPLARKIAIVTTIKLLGLLGLWWLFFSGPGDSNLTPDQVSHAILHPTNSHSNFSSKARQGGDEYATKTVQIARQEAGEEANAVSPMKWNWNNTTKP